MAMTERWPDEIPLTDHEVMTLAEILTSEAVGREHAITASELADRLTLDETKTSKVRKAIKAGLIAEQEIPVRGSTCGYWIPRSRQAAMDAIDDLQGRIEGIQQRQRLLGDAIGRWDWDRWPDDVVADGGERELTSEEREFLKENPIDREELLEHRSGQ